MNLFRFLDLAHQEECFALMGNFLYVSCRSQHIPGKYVMLLVHMIKFDV